MVKVSSFLCGLQGPGSTALIQTIALVLTHFDKSITHTHMTICDTMHTLYVQRGHSALEPVDGTKPRGLSCCYLLPAVLLVALWRASPYHLPQSPCGQ